MKLVLRKIFHVLEEWCMILRVSNTPVSEVALWGRTIVSAPMADLLPECAGLGG